MTREGGSGNENGKKVVEIYYPEKFVYPSSSALHGTLVAAASPNYQ